MSKRRDIHVVPRGDGWARVKEGSSRAGSVHHTQKEAISKARDIATRERVSVVVHGKDGRIRDSSSYGKDPLPPRERSVKPPPRSGTIRISKIKQAAKRAKL